MMAKKPNPARSKGCIPIEQCHLYGLQSPHALAKRLGWDLHKLEDLASNGTYRVFTLKATGRLVEEPRAPLQSLHKQIHRYLSRVAVPDYLHSAVKGRSYLSNARTHIGATSMIKIDVKQFFPSVSQRNVRIFFRDTMKCAPDVAGFIANLICKDGRLATGSSASPIISYYAFKTMFDEIHELANAHGLKMSCYVDDITLSGAGATRLVLHEVRKIILRSGLNAHKAKYFVGNGPKIVTGAMVTSNGLELPFVRWKNIKMQISDLRNCKTDEERLDIFPKLVSRLYEAAQLDTRCRRIAEHHHAEWKKLKAAL